MQRIKKDFEREHIVNPPGPDKKPTVNFDLDLDLLPEFCQYKDEGCDLAASCLECPFQRCIYDTPRGRNKKIKLIRDIQILRLHTWKKMTIKELAVLFNLSERSVARIIAKQKSGETR